MSPLIIDEEQIFPFNFWFNGTIRCGMHHNGELYCRVESFPLQKRPLVYQLGCKLARQHMAIALSSSVTTCSLWGSLRDAPLKRVLTTVTATSLLDAMLYPLTSDPADSYQTSNSLTPPPDET